MREGRDMEHDKQFVREYFFQTRREIDTEKNSRDQILNFVIVALGAIGFAVFQSDKSGEFLSEPIAVLMPLSMLCAITALFWLRRKKLQQIADRWFVLEHLVAHHIDDLPRNVTLEAVVHKDLQTTRYTRKDVWVSMGVSLPVYGIIVHVLDTTLAPLAVAGSVAAVFATHLALSWLLLGRPFDCPEPLKSHRQRGQEVGQRGEERGG